MLRCVGRKKITISFKEPGASQKSEMTGHNFSDLYKDKDTN